MSINLDPDEAPQNVGPHLDPNCKILKNTISAKLLTETVHFASFERNKTSFFSFKHNMQKLKMHRWNTSWIDINLMHRSVNEWLNFYLVKVKHDLYIIQIQSVLVQSKLFT